MLDKILCNLKEAQSLLNRLIDDKETLQKIADAAGLYVDAIKTNHKLMSCGNGGSHCDAMHFAEELTGRFRKTRVALPAWAISDPAHISCTANDFGFEYVFSRAIEALGNPGDVLLAISTSGQSQNIIHAVEAAKDKGMKVVGLTGRVGTALEDLADITVAVPGGDYADRIQELHIKVIHIWIELIERSLFPQLYQGE